MRLRVLAAAVLPVVLAGCGAPGGAPAPGDGGPAGDVTVLAAASLTESFTEIGRQFEAAHPGTTVRFSFAGSSQLAAQIVAGAPADVFAAASPATMRTVVDAGAAVGEPVILVRNQLVIAVPKGNPARVRTLADLARPGVTVALCAEQVPCGAAAKQVLTGVPLTPVTLEQDVKAALSKVRLGEVDAALVYRTDARAAAADVEAIEFAASAAATNDYPIAALADAPNPTGAAAFVAWARGAPALDVLTRAGFQPPVSPPSAPA
ncbi:molybdate ABC transporter substrate-binding protein [Spirilliplanes yamanashiensis]|uniref:Molybdate-binding protein n=1 Tax=Spirilliplanes yamanashiensis TaxID=42233 RepID=A0A8J3Y9C1_9ACTN|nr:molybdate ABC transporter substrate-binding protein [Spirilliplanes yamanashiensis]MDP9815650.1 molybdate transport system substrate-binding protein [Spirilliplanes yamanashiensis]GIJ03904.1 molybdate-binding protein [Spirilliplanes yamanashiensis]